METTHKSIVLENDSLAAEILPELGGKVWRLTDKRREKQWIWNNSKVPLQSPSPEASYDDCWSGGWEELFPNDAAGTFNGRTLPDHGEWWSRAWTHETLSDGAIRMRLETKSMHASCEKTVRLKGNTLSIAYRIENLEEKEIQFLFKQHLAIALEPQHVIEIPGGTVTPVDTTFSTRLTSSEPFAWPGEAVNLSRPSPREDKKREFVYIENLPSPWCGVHDPQSGARIRMHYPADVFPYVWIFMDLGGWRDYYTAVLEPCTNMPKDLSEAVKTNRCARLGPKKILECTVRVELS